MHLKKMKNGRWIGRCNSGKTCYITEGNTLQECQDKIFNMMLKEAV